MLFQQLKRNEQLTKQLTIIENDDFQKIIKQNNNTNLRFQLQHAKKLIRNLFFLLNTFNMIFLRLTSIVDDKTNQIVDKSLMKKLIAFHNKYNLQLDFYVANNENINTNRDMINFLQSRIDHFKILQKIFEIKVNFEMKVTSHEIVKLNHAKKTIKKNTKNVRKRKRRKQRRDVSKLRTGCH